LRHSVDDDDDDDDNDDDHACFEHYLCLMICDWWFCYSLRVLTR